MRCSTRCSTPTSCSCPAASDARRPPRDERLLEWLRAVAPRCQWMAASSTGTVVVAAAGLLGEHEAATHWLASSLLESYGSAASTERIVEVGNIITCEGRSRRCMSRCWSRCGWSGPDMVAQVRAGSPERQAPTPTGRTPWQRWRHERDRRRRGPGKPRNPELAAPDVIEFDPLTRIELNIPCRYVTLSAMASTARPGRTLDAWINGSPDTSDAPRHDRAPVQGARWRANLDARRCVMWSTATGRRSRGRTTRPAVEQAAVGLIALGVEPGDRVAVLASNRPEWHIADLAIMSAGAVTVPVYPTSSSSQVAYILDNSDAHVCFVDDTEQLAKVLLHLPNLPALERIVSFGRGEGLDRAGLLITLDDLRAGETPRPPSSTPASMRSHPTTSPRSCTRVAPPGHRRGCASPTATSPGRSIPSTRSSTSAPAIGCCRTCP